MTVPAAINRLPSMALTGAKPYPVPAGPRLPGSEVSNSAAETAADDSAAKAAPAGDNPTSLAPAPETPKAAGPKPPKAAGPAPPADPEVDQPDPDQQ